MTINNLRGTVDILPDECVGWDWVESTVRKVYSLFGFDEIRTPVFERTELFSRSIGEGTDIVNKEMYTFSDRKERSLTLRPEGTASVVRACLQHKMIGENLTQKLFYFGPMFRYEKPQAGRQRQFHQTGVELVGSPSPLADVEVILILDSLFKALGLKKVKYRINSTGSREGRGKLVEALKGWVEPNLEKMCPDCHTRYEKNILRVYDCKVPGCRAIVDSLPGITSLLSEEDQTFFTQVTDALKKKGIKYEIDSRLVRGLDYYTQTIFEAYSEDLGACDAIAGGGRYNNLFSDMGAHIKVPAVGFAIGLERLMLLLRSAGLLPSKKRTDFYIVGNGLEDGLNNLSFAEKMREEGFVVELDLLARKMKAQLRAAKRVLPQWVVIRGEDEITQGKLVLRHYESQEEKNLTEEEFFSSLTSSLFKN